MENRYPRVIDAHVHWYPRGDLHPAEPETVVEALTDDFTRDVEVTRRLYRSGESEYLIDGESCRLRDVQDLLMDAGLGVKAIHDEPSIC